MSRIFDALQQSVAQQLPGEPPFPLEIAELLQVTETRKAAAERVLCDQEPGVSTRSTIAESEVVTLPAATAQTTAHVPSQTASAAAGAFPHNPLAQFQSRQMFIPRQSRLVCITDKESLAAEKFRYISLRLLELRRKRPVKKVLITSALRQEGKSMVAANLACALAHAKQEKVLLLDGDLRQPSLAPLFGLGKIPGMCEWLQGNASSLTGIYHLEGADCWLMPAGNTPQHPVELMHSSKFAALLDQLTVSFDWIVIDSPPVLPLAYTSIWIRHVDGALLVSREGMTEKDQVNRCAEAIEPSKLLGTIYNCSSNTADEEYSQSYRPGTLNVGEEAQCR